MDTQSAYIFFIFLGVVLPIGIAGYLLWYNRWEQRQEEEAKEDE